MKKVYVIQSKLWMQDWDANEKNSTHFHIRGVYTKVEKAKDYPNKIGVAPKDKELIWREHNSHGLSWETSYAYAYACNGKVRIEHWCITEEEVIE